MQTLHLFIAIFLCWNGRHTQTAACSIRIWMRKLLLYYLWRCTNANNILSSSILFILQNDAWQLRESANGSAVCACVFTQYPMPWWWQPSWDRLMCIAYSTLNILMVIVWLSFLHRLHISKLRKFRWWLFVFFSFLLLVGLTRTSNATREWTTVNISATCTLLVPIHTTNGLI